METRKSFLEIRKRTFGPILKISINALKRETISNGFKACGLQPWNFNVIDYSKCLGKNSNTEENNEYQEGHQEDVTQKLSFDIFSNIVGKENVDKMAGGMESHYSHGNCEFLNLLNRIYCFFKPERNLVNQSIIEINEYNSEDDQIRVLYTEQDFAAMPVVIDDMPAQFENTFKVVHNEEKITIHQNIDITIKEDTVVPELIDNSKTTYINTESIASEYNPEREIPCYSKVESTESDYKAMKATSSMEEVNNREIILGEAKPIEAIPYQRKKDDNISNRIEESADGTENINAVRSKSLGKIVVGKTPEKKDNNLKVDLLKKIEDYLLKAKTPQRKGKIKSERVPYVITSTAYKKIVEEKERIKEEKEKKKEDNQRKRLLKTLGEKEQNSGNKKLNKKQKLNLNSSVEGSENGSQIQHLRDIPEPTVISEFQKNKQQSHVRNVFNTQQNASELKNNISVPRGLCFMCVKHIYLTNIGVKCQDCNRTYHVQCLKNKNIYKNFYRCSVCTMKKDLR